jgi:hypothetical protein
MKLQLAIASQCSNVVMPLKKILLSNQKKTSNARRCFASFMVSAMNSFVVCTFSGDSSDVSG